MAKFHTQTVPFSELMTDDKLKIGGTMFIVTSEAHQSYGVWRVRVEPIKIRRSGRQHEYASLTMPGHTKMKIYNQK